MFMTPEQKRQKIQELNERARQKLLAENANGEPTVERNVYVWYNGKLVDMPESIAKKYGHKY